MVKILNLNKEKANRTTRLVYLIVSNVVKAIIQIAVQILKIIQNKQFLQCKVLAPLTNMNGNKSIKLTYSQAREVYE